MPTILPAEPGVPSCQRRIQTHASGFTIIELMAVVSILSILTVIALSTYQDYATRAKVSEGLAFAAEARTSVSEYVYSNGSFPSSNQQAGLSAPQDYDVFDNLARLEIRSNEPRRGTIEITFSIPNLAGDDKLQLIPNTGDGVVSWTCQPAEENGISITRVPPSCRGG